MKSYIVDVAHCVLHLRLFLQEAMSKTSSERFGISAAASLSTTPDGVEAPKFGEDSFSSDRFKSSGGEGTTTVNIYLKDSGEENADGDGEGTPATKAGSVSGSFEETSSESSTSSSSSAFDSFARSKSQSEAASKIASKKIRIIEVNIGGLPNTDWREWAASVKQKPMPISYDLVGLWNLMDNALAESFFEAYMHMEALKALNTNSGPYLDVMHFGVSRGSGEPLSTYSSDPNVDFRALLRVDQIEATVSEEIKDLVVVGETFQPIVDRPLGKDLFACGIQVARNLKKDTSLGNKIGVEAVSFRFCSASNWRSQSEWLKIGKENTKPPGDSLRNSTCPDNQFIDGMRVRYCADSSCASIEEEDGPTTVIDALGISGIQITCNALGGSEFTRTIQEVYCSDLPRNETQTDCGADSSWGKWNFLPPTDSLDTVNVIVGASIEQGSHKESESPMRAPVGLKGKSNDLRAQLDCFGEPFSSLINQLLGNCGEDDLINISDEDLIHNENVQKAFKASWKAFSELDDDLGVVGIKLLYKEVPIAGSGFANSAISYSATWKGKGTRPAAVFATSIRGNEGKSSEEESMYSFQTLQDLTEIPYSLSYFAERKKSEKYSQNANEIVGDFIFTVDITEATFDEYLQEKETMMRNNLQELFNEYVLVNNVTVEEALNNGTILEFSYLLDNNITGEATFTNTTLDAFDVYLQAESIPVKETLTDTTSTIFNEFLQAKNFTEEENPTLTEYRQELFHDYLEEKDIVLEEPPPFETFDEYLQRTSNQDVYSISLVNNIPFGLSNDYSSAGVIAMSNFGQVRINSHLLNDQDEMLVS